MKLMNNQAANQKAVMLPNQINNLSQTVTELSTNLNSLKPNNSKEVQVITYTLLAMALVGIYVYHYINSQDANK